VKNPINLKLIAKKLHANTYDQIDQLYCDILDISHNLAIIHGGKLRYLIIAFTYSLHIIRK
jgi:hypothetical protein